jgi:PAS domain S-box-containing protein
VVESFPDMILVVDYRGRTLYLNPAMVRQTGLTLSDFQGAVPSGLVVHPEDRERVGRETLEFIGSDRQMTGLIENRVILNGEVRWRSGVICKITYQGEPALMIISRDISAQKHAETERERLIADLEARNAELERFTYTVSHDLKAPLITIAGFLGQLERDAALDDPVRLADDHRRIGDAVRKMHRLLNELLELSRVGRLVNASESVPFAEIAREALAMVRGTLEARGVTVTIADGLPDVLGDRPRLVEVLQNLLDNAAKFMGAQPDPRVQIGVRTGIPDGPVFYVRDNGAGIAPEFHERVFGLFTRLDPSTEGSGIGLALVRRIVEVHGGNVWVESAGDGKGSTFCFTLPGVPGRAGA